MNAKIVGLGVILIIIAMTYHVSAQTFSKTAGKTGTWTYLSTISAAPIEVYCPEGWVPVLMEGSGPEQRVLCGTQMVAGRCLDPGTWEPIFNYCVAWGEIEETPAPIVQPQCTFWQQLLGRCAPLSITPAAVTTTTLGRLCMPVQTQCYGSQCFKVCRDSYYDINKDCCIPTMPLNIRNYNTIKFSRPTSTTLPLRRIDAITLWFTNLFK